MIPGWEDPLEDSMSAHSSVLAWRIPWTEDPRGVAKSWTRLSDLARTRKTPLYTPPERGGISPQSLILKLHK